MLDTLCKLRNGPLLPRLQTIGVHRKLPCDIVQFSAIIAPPTLTEINLDLHELKAGTLPALATSCPAVQHARFVTDPWTGDSAELADTVPLWRGLREFSLRVTLLNTRGSRPTTPIILDYRLLHELSMLPVLDKLRIDMYPAVSNPQFRGGNRFLERPFLFRSLLRLALSGDTSLIRVMLEDISSPSLLELEIRSHDTSVFSVPEPLIRDRPFVRDLQKLKIVYSQPQNGHHGTVVLGAFLLPLSHMHRLRELSLSIGNFFMITYPIESTDADWGACVPSWPHLRRLEIIDGNRAATRPTMRTLVLLARHCPRLESIEMTMCEEEHTAHGQAGSHVPMDPGVGERSANLEVLPVHAHLTHLQLRYSVFPGCDLDNVARDMARMFPRLFKVTRVIEVPLDPPPVPRMYANVGIYLARGKFRAQEVAWEEFMHLVKRHQ